MNSYRVALILCRAVAVALWWLVGIRVLPVLIEVMGDFSHLMRAFGVPGVTLFSVAFYAVAAIFLQMFSASLAASMVGKTTLESETIASRNVLEPPERALASAGAGLFLLFFLPFCR